MREYDESLSSAGPVLESQDLVDLERALQDALKAHVPFTSYSLYFPRTAPKFAGRAGLTPAYKAREGQLVLPLVQGGRLLGYFLARGVKLAAPKAEQRLLAALAGQILERLALHKKGITDQLTGLSTREHLVCRLTREIELVQNCLAPDKGQDPDLQGFSGSAGLVLLDLDGFQQINERYGYTVGDAILAEVGRALKGVAPRHVTAARLVDDKFALLLPDARPRSCFQLAEVVREAVARVAFSDPAGGDAIRITGSLGFANHPQNLSGPQLARTAQEQARILLRKAQKAVGLAKDLGRNRVLAYGDILKSGGKVLEVLPLGRLCVGLGRSVGAAEGQRFLVASPRFSRPAEARLTEDERLVGRYPVMYKGEVVLCEVQEDLCFAEVLHVNDPSFGFEAGDRLSLVQEREGLYDAEAAEDNMARTKSDDGILGYRDFLAFFLAARARSERFGLVLLKVLDQPKAGAANYQRSMDARVRKAADLAQERLTPEAMGRFGLAGLAAFVPGQDPADLKASVQALVEAAARKKQTLAAGIAPYPCLSFGRADVLENARKALEHALLLPAPRAALFDSVSLNISADKLAQDGDLYAAIEEYKLALLADDTNHLAHNSLGICLAQMNRLDQAKRHFERALALAPDNPLALYNLGWTCQRLGEFPEARQAFERCLELDPANVFSLIRLGTLAEREGDIQLAERRFSEAAALPGGETLAVRHLARLALSRRDFEQARELLHRALSANHNDAHSMHLLATLYLDAGEDPQIAEVLARQAAALLPERPEFRATLSRALSAQGRRDEALMALGRRAG